MNVHDVGNDDAAQSRVPMPFAAESARGDGVQAAMRDAVTAYIEANGGGQGLFETPVPGFHILRSFQIHKPAGGRIYRPSLCVVVQGAKQIMFGEQTLDYGAMECLVVSVEIPAHGQIVAASADEPFIGMTIDLDIGLLREIATQLDVPPADDATSGPCVFVGQVDGPLADCVLRLVRMSHTPKAVPILYPAVMREILYWLVAGPNGGEIRKLGLPETHTDRVAKAIYYLRDNYTRTLRVEQLAETARMSASSFHQHFKAMTSMTPLQYQKQLRLLEARRLMVAEAMNVAEAAYRVGYESASQFSREYSRAFGISPKRSAMSARAAAE